MWYGQPPVCAVLIISAAFYCDKYVKMFNSIFPTVSKKKLFCALSGFLITNIIGAISQIR